MKDKFVKTFQNPWFVAMVVAAFASVISFFQINSYKADLHHLNTLWTVSGIVFGVLACFFLYKTNQTSTGTGG